LILPSSIEQYPLLLNGLKPLSEQDRQSHLRNLCTNDLYFLLRYVCGRKDLEHEWLFQRCREVQANPNGYLDLWSREHYKTSIISFGLTVQDILNDPEITVGIFSHTRPIAKSLLRQIKREFETNALLITLFPDILWENPVRDAPTWSEDSGIIVKRKTNPKEATVEGWGLIDGMPTGRHFKLRILDDTVTRESVTTPEQIKKTTDAWELADNLGTVGGWVRTIGTRYHLGDTYSVMMQRQAVIPRIYAATHNGRMDGTPVLFTPEEWERRKRTQSRTTIAAQLLQNPLADEDATFRPEWLRPYEVRPRTLNIYITCDPSKGKHATSDNTAISVIGVASTGGKYLLDGYCHRMSLSQRWVAIRDLYRRWSKTPGVQLVFVGYERYGAQSDDEYFQEQMERTKEIFPIEELNWPREGGNSKKDRVERLEPDFRNARFHLPLAVWREGKPCTWSVDTDPESKTYQTILWKEVEGFTKLQIATIEAGSPELVAKAIKRYDAENKVYDLTQRFMEEYLTFPFGQHDDLVDAASRIYDLECRPPTIISKHAGEPATYFDS
jgi:hypothetical protein